MSLLNTFCIFKKPDSTPFLGRKKSIIFLQKFLQKDLDLSIFISIFAANNINYSYMDLNDFSKIFLPNLVSEYVKGTLPLHALVDLDTWKKVFPDKGYKQSKQFPWYQVEFTCNALKDRTILLSFILPQPKKYGEAKYAAIRLNPEEHAQRRAVYYILTKPQNYDDQWDIHYLPLPLGADKMELKFKQKITGTDSLRNFVYDVQQIPFDDDSYNKSIIDGMLDLFGNIFSSQD